MGVSTGQNDSFQTMSNNIRKISQNLGQYIAVRRDVSFRTSSTSTTYKYSAKDYDASLYYSDTVGIVVYSSFGYPQIKYSLLNYKTITYSSLSGNISTIIGKYLYTYYTQRIPGQDTNENQPNQENQLTIFKVSSASYNYDGKYNNINVTGYPVLCTQMQSWEVFKDKPSIYTTNNWSGEKLTEQTGITRIFSANYWVS